VVLEVSTAYKKDLLYDIQMSKIPVQTRILYVTDGLAAGGKERQLLELIKNLDKKEFVCGVITFNSNQHYSAQVKDSCARYWELKKRPTRLEPLISIWKCFRKFKPDIVHTWDSLSSFYAFLPCKVFNIPLIDGSIRDAGIDKGREFYFKRFFLKRADRVISNSYAGLKKYKIAGWVIYNAIDISRFLQNVKTEEFNIIMTANFTDYKDHDAFLKAAIDLMKNRIVDQVYLLGDGPSRQKYIDWVENNYPSFSAKIHFPGAVYNVEEYLATCRIGVLCSTERFSEGISNSVLEYMAAGLVPLMTDTGAAREILKDGVNGFLFAPGDWQRIVNIIKQLKADRLKKEIIVQSAKKTITENFDLKTNLSKYTSIYRELKSRKGK
jgi:glycosyltransferase involved in cell wall biosynthesis